MKSKANMGSIKILGG